MEQVWNERQGKAAYLRLYRKLMEGILSGAYPYGSRLPSKRTIAADSGLSVITVEHAVGLLCEEGYVESRERSGYFVIYRGEDFLGSGLEQTVDRDPGPGMHAGSDSLIPYSTAAKTVRGVLQKYGERILVKSPNHGSPELRSEICAYLLRSRGIRVRPSQVIIGSGAEYLYGLLVQLLGTEPVYAVEHPCFSQIQKVYETMGVRLEKLRMGTDGILSEELAASRASVLHVTPFHSYPSGVTASISKKHEYLRWARSRNGILIEDNYDSELTVSTKPEEPLFSIAEGATVIYINTFSQTIAPSIRIGYMILPESLESRFQDRLGFYSCTVSVLDQYVLAELIRSGDFERHINRVRRARRKRENPSG